ncbi:hypothetical protein CR513_11267, partial [Mucuna pruriens]
MALLMWGVDILGPFPLAIVDYFTKWIEAEPVATISVERVRFPTIISNGLAEVPNRVILRVLHKRFEEAKGRWLKELPHVLWSYHTTLHSTTQETLFRLTFGNDRWRNCFHAIQGEGNKEELMENLDLLQEEREMMHIRKYATKARVVERYNSIMFPYPLRQGNLVLRRVLKGVATNKLTPNWKGPFRIREDMGHGAFKLEQLDEKLVPRT